MAKTAGLDLPDAAVRAASESLGGEAESLALATSLLRVNTAHSAVRRAVAYCADRLTAPAAGWAVNGDPSTYSFVDAKGIAPQQRGQVRRVLPALPRQDPTPDWATAAFARAVEARGAVAMPAGGAVLMAGAVNKEARATLSAVADLLKTALARRQADEHAAGAERDLDRRLTWTAHEIKGPLLGLKATAERVLATEDLSAEGRSLLRRSHAELLRLADLVDELLRWGSGPNPASRTTTRVVSVIEAAVALCEPRRNRVDVICDDSTHVFADPLQLKIALCNLVRNALDYSPPNARVTVTAARSGSTVDVMVADRGPGVAATEAAAIFQPMYRGRAGRMTRDGRGLGLFIARQVVEGHGGSIWVEEGSPGAVFRIRLRD